MMTTMMAVRLHVFQLLARLVQLLLRYRVALEQIMHQGSSGRCLGERQRMYIERGKRTLGRVGTLVISSTTSEQRCKSCLLADLVKIRGLNLGVHLPEFRGCLMQSARANSCLRLPAITIHEIKGVQRIVGSPDNGACLASGGARPAAITLQLRNSQSWQRRIGCKQITMHAFWSERPVP